MTDPKAKAELSSVFPLLALFTYEHLPPHLQEISKPFCELADQAAARAMARPGFGPLVIMETHKTLDHLMYAKDAAVRAVVAGK